MELFNKKELNQLDFLKDQITSESSEESVTSQNKKIEKILILDTETTGLDENKDEVIEIGCILFDVSFKCVLSQVSFLFPVNVYFSLFGNIGCPSLSASSLSVSLA